MNTHERLHLCSGRLRRGQLIAAGLHWGNQFLLNVMVSECTIRYLPDETGIIYRGIDRGRNSLRSGATRQGEIFRLGSALRCRTGTTRRTFCPEKL